MCGLHISSKLKTGTYVGTAVVGLGLVRVVRSFEGTRKSVVREVSIGEETLDGGI